MMPIKWNRVSAYGIVSICGKWRIGRYVTNGVDQFALWNGFKEVWRGLNPKEAKEYAEKNNGP